MGQFLSKTLNRESDREHIERAYLMGKKGSKNTAKKTHKQSAAYLQKGPKKKKGKGK